MAEQAFPLEVRTADLEIPDGEHAVHHQLAIVGQHHTARTREFAATVYRAVGHLWCVHDEEPQRLPDIRSIGQRRDAAKAYPGLCGVHLASLIAAVTTEDVERTASRRGQAVTYRTFRNQACHDAALALNVRGAGVQVGHGKCFEKACQALWPGDAPVDEWAAIAFSSDNVQAVSVTEGNGAGVEEASVTEG